MKRIMITLFSVAALCSCGGEKKTPAIDTANFDNSIALQDDFYEHFTAGWQRNHPMKPEYSRYGAFDMLRESNELRIKELFAELESKTVEEGSVEQKIADLYRMGLDSTRLNAEGAAPLREALDAIEGVDCRCALSGLIGRMHYTSGNPFFYAMVSADEMNTSANVLYLGQAGLGLGDRDYYFDESGEAIRTAYGEYIRKVMALAGYSEEECARIAENVMTIEKALASAHYTNVELRNPHKNYNRTTLKALKRTYRNIDWDAYSAAMNFDMPEELVVSQKPALAKANELVGKTPLRTIKDYLLFHEVSSAAPYLSDDFSAANFDFYGRTLSGQQEQRPRWKRSLGTANSLLSEAVGELYVAKFFPVEYKEKMLSIVGNLQVALSQHINALEWMSDVTKAKAQEKLATFTVKIGYPDKWKDYSSLAINPSQSYLANMRAASAWYTSDNLSDLNKPVDKDRWFMSPQTVNAYYNPTTNEICFPAAILQPPFFNPEADDAVNYGAIGVVIGHEMTHGFDDQGRQYDKDGNLRDWWTKEDAEAFDKKAQVLVKQFDAIEVNDEGLHANGAFTLGENIADQGGLRVAYTALQNALGGVEPEKIDGFTAAQRFYIAYTTLWAQNIRPEEVVRLTKIDPHSLGKWRVNGTLPNIAEWYEAFGIESGAMFRPEEERVIIW